MAEDRLRSFDGRRRRLVSFGLGVLLRLLFRALLLLEFAPFRFGELFFLGGLPSLARFASNSALRLAFSAAFLAFSSSVGGAMVTVRAVRFGEYRCAAFQ